MFNESINFNISYGRVGADQDDVEKVAALADIHSKVLTLLARLSRSNNFVQVASRTSLTVCLLDCVVARWLRNQGWGAWAQTERWREAESGNCKNFTQVQTIWNAVGDPSI